MKTTTDRLIRAPATVAADVPSVSRVAIAGLGTIGRKVADTLAKELIPSMRLTAVSARDQSKARSTLKTIGIEVPVLPPEELASVADLVVECAPAAVLQQIAEPVLSAGKKLIVLSVGALLSHWELVDLARRSGGQIIVPSGALIGLDAVSAAAEGQIDSVQMTTRKPVNGLLGAPFLVENRINIEGLGEPMRVFSGTAREAAEGFPANLNVAVALSLAGIGPDRTRLDIWADPGVSRNIHKIVVRADSASFEMTIENIPSENPKTGQITALSVVAVLRKQRAPLRVGT